MKEKRVIVWFRQDLRLHDNEALSQAINQGEEVIPVFVFDDRFFKAKTKYGFAKTGAHRAKFTIQAVKELREALRAKGSDLIIREGHTEEEIFKIARMAKTSWVFCNRERTQEEVDIQDALEKRLWSVGQEIVYSRGKMLYYTQDLPFPVTHTPDLFTAYRKEVEKFTPIREPLPTPAAIPTCSVDIDLGELPSLSDFGLEEPVQDERAVLQFVGGEKAGLDRLNYYLWESDAIKSYKETRTGLIGGDYSSKLSPWLSLGCISPKMVYAEVKKYEEERGANKSTYLMFFELLWRDYFRLMGKKYGNAIFQKEGLVKKGVPNAQDDGRLLELWTKGRTGVPFIDANMRELSQTGFMSNLGRQNVSSFLVKDLHVNWQMGAEWFESMLLDYDPCSNYGNWNYIAGVGNDTRDDRYINILSQAKRYDPDGQYIKHWLPELAALPEDKIHRPDQLTAMEQASLGIKLGIDYPKAMIGMNKWERSY